MLCRLEAEVKEAQLRAKQELLRGAQIAQEVAARELAQQRAAYEHRIEALEAQLVTAGFLLAVHPNDPRSCERLGRAPWGDHVHSRGPARGAGQAVDRRLLDSNYFCS